MFLRLYLFHPFFYYKFFRLPLTTPVTFSSLTRWDLLDTPLVLSSSPLALLQLPVRNNPLLIPRDFESLTYISIFILENICGKKGCWSKCSTDTGKPISGDWSEGQPWCYLQDQWGLTEGCDGCDSMTECNDHYKPHAGCAPWISLCLINIGIWIKNCPLVMVTVLFLCDCNNRAKSLLFICKRSGFNSRLGSFVSTWGLESTELRSITPPCLHGN